MRPHLLSVALLNVFLFISCNKEDSVCNQRYYYYDSKKYYLTEIPYMGTISFYDTLLYDSVYNILKDFQGINLTNLDSQFKRNYLIVDIDSRSCHETDEIFEEIKQNHKISNCNKWLINEKGNEIGIYDVFICKLKHDSLKSKMYEIINNTKTTFIRESRHHDYYMIRADKNSLDDALEMSNYFYESGYFEWAQPDFIGGIYFFKK